MPARVYGCCYWVTPASWAWCCWLVLSLFSDLRERVADNDAPLPFRGLPAELISAGLMAVAFLGFNAMIKT